MTSQTFDEDDLAFEQRLLGAGQTEALPHERTEAARLRFAAGLAALQGGVVGGAALSGPVAASSGSAWSRFLATAKWVALGAIAGGVATFFWVQHAAPRNLASAPAVPPAVVQAAASPKLSQPSDARPTQPTEPAPSAGTQAPPTARPSAAPSGRTAKPASDLAAEVAALDGIRTALAIGAWSDAEQQLARYRRTFVAGALRTEAEVLTIETLRAQGREQAAASAAERFIVQHPRDPQVARVRAQASALR
jgi:hypothetical protein